MPLRRKRITVNRQPLWARRMELRLRGLIMATFDEVRSAYKSYATELRNQRDAAIALAEAKVAEANQIAQDLAAFQANDAETDASQLAERTQQLADSLQADLDELKGQPEPTEPEVTEPPAEEQPNE